jgi:hypothetical protein
MDKATIIGNIVTGECDDFLADILDAARTRKQVKAANVPFRPGLTIRISGLTPAYINGAECIITKVNPKKLVVTFPNDPRFGRFAGSARVTVPKSACEIVEPSID